MLINSLKNKNEKKSLSKFLLHHLFNSSTIEDRGQRVMETETHKKKKKHKKNEMVVTQKKKHLYIIS